VDLDALRSLIPVTQTTAYLNTGTAAPWSTPVVAAIEHALRRELALGRALPAGLPDFRPLLGETRARLAQWVAADADEVALTHSATEGIDIVAWGLDWQPGDEVITTSIEHRGVLVPLRQLAQRKGVTVRTADVGAGDPAQTQAAIEALIDSALIENAAVRLHVDVTDSELAQAEAMIKAENHLDDAGLDKALADQHFTRATYRRELARQIRMQRTFALDAPSVRGQVTDAELQARYDEAKKANPSIGSFDSLKDQIREAVYSEKTAIAQGEWVKRMRATAHVERSK